MKINAKDLCSIKDIQELKSVDSINNILKVINSEINIRIEIIPLLF